MTTILSGSLNKEKTEAFTTALKDILTLGILKIILEFSASDKKISINAVNDNNTVMAKINFDPCLLDGFEIKNDFSYGIYNLDEFIGLLSIFENGCDIKMSEESLGLSFENNALDYLGSELKKIKVGPGAFSIDVFSSVFDWDSKKYNSLIRAMNKMPQQFVFIKGIEKKSEIELLISENGVRSNSFGITIPCTGVIEKNFKHFLSKESLTQAFNTSIKTFNAKICDICLVLIGSSSLYNVQYFIANSEG